MRDDSSSNDSYFEKDSQEPDKIEKKCIKKEEEEKDFIISEYESDLRLIKLPEKDYQLKAIFHQDHLPFINEEGWIEKTIKEIKKDTRVINQPDDDGITILHRILNTNGLPNKPELINFLLENKADPNQESDDNSILFSAFMVPNIQIEIIHSLIDNKARFSEWNEEADSVLYHLCTSKESIQTEILKKILELKANPNYQPENGEYTSFQAACLCGANQNTIKILLQNKADVNLENDRGHENSFHCLFSNKKVLNLDFIKTMLKNKADPNSLDSNKNTPFYLFCSEKDISDEKLKVMFNYGANPFIPDNQITSFHQYCRNKKMTKNGIEMFIEKKVDINSTSFVYPPSFILYQNKNFDLHILKFMIETKTDMNAKDRNGNTFLHFIFSNKDLKLETATFFEDEIKKNVKNKTGQTSFDIYLSGKHYDYNLMKYMIETKADYSFFSKRFSLIQRLCQTKNVSPETLQYLIDLKCSLNKVDENKKLPLHHLLESKSLKYETVQVMLRNFEKKNINALTKNKITPISNFCFSSSVNNDILKLLIENKADINIPNTQNYLPIHFLCQNPNYDIRSSSFFVNQEMLNKKTRLGFTPLICYFFSRNIEFEKVKFLLENKADPNVQKYIKYPLSYLNISEMDKEELVSYLNLFFSFGADPNIKGEHEKTFFYEYCSSENYFYDVAKTFFENKADANIEDYDKNTPFQKMCKFTTLSVKNLQLFVDHKANIFSKNKNLDSPFFTVCKNPSFDYDILKFFVDRKVDLNLRNLNFQNAFSILIEENRIQDIEVYKYFVENGFKIESLNNDSKINLMFNLSRKSVQEQNCYLYEKNYDLIYFLIANGVGNNCKSRTYQNKAFKNVVSLLEDKGTIWQQSKHHLFPVSFKEKIFMFIVAIKIFSKKINYLLPKPILFIIITLISIQIRDIQNKRKIDQYISKASSKKLRKKK